MWEAIEKFFEPSTTIRRPFDGFALDFCGELSRTLFARNIGNRYPDLAALAYWLRPANIELIQQDFGTDFYAQPRGRVFHIAPANVETLFVYSWILSLLCGNANIVRLPSKVSDGLRLLYSCLNEVMHVPSLRPINDTTSLISYGHEEEVTSYISERADMRVIWGGDETVKAIRKVPLRPTATEIVFPDRYSYAIMQSQRYAELDDAGRDQLAQAFFNDLFWYDQAACSSPRALFWVGPPSDDFYKRLQKLIKQKHYAVPLGMALQKETYLYTQAAEHSFKSVKRISNELTIIELEKFEDFCRSHCGGGLIYQIQIPGMDALLPTVIQKDQTLTYFGFQRDELYTFIRKLNGRGLDRIVPIGQALQFHHHWDGYNLLKEFTRRVYLA